MTEEIPRRPKARVINSRDVQDATDDVVVTYSPCGGPEGGRRIRFVPFDGNPIEAEWLRVTETKDAAGWRETGSQPVESISIEIGSEVLLE